MAKKYDFRIVVRAAEFNGDLVTVLHGGTKDVFAEKTVEMTLAQAIAEQQRMSDEEPRSSATFLTMRYRDDVKAPGIGKVKPIYKEAK